MTGGEALREFVDARWSRKQGGIRGLAAALGTSVDTVYRWFNESSPPDTDQLQALADLLGVRRYEIVAAMDGEPTVLPLNEATRGSFLALMEEWADQRGLPRPRREPPKESDAA